MRTAYVLIGLLAATACGGDRGGELVAVAPPPWLDQKVDDQARTADPAAQRVGDLYHGIVYERAPVEWLVHLDVGHCYWFSGAGAEGVEKLSWFMWDPSNSRVTSAKPGTPTVLSKYCPTQAGPYKMQAKTGGKGFVAFGVYAVDAAAAPVAAPTVAPPAKTDLNAMIDQQAASAAPGATRTGDYFTGAGDKSEWSVALAANTCYWFIGVGDPGKVKQLTIYVWDPKQKRVTESHNDNNVAVAGTCAPAAGMFKFQAKVQSGGGDYKVAVFSKPQ